MGTSTGHVLAGDGTQISYRTTESPGDNSPVVVLIHGWAQSSRSWGDVLVDELSKDFRVIAIDLRGHGDSSVPAEGHLTADDFGGDIAAVLSAEVAGEQPVFLLGWSYGGLVIGDYLKYRAQGASPAAGNLAGLILVDAITSMGRGEAGGRVGPAMRAALPAAYSEDPAVATAALQSFADALVPAQQGPLAQQFLGTSLTVPPAVRAGLFGRTASYDDLFAGFGGAVMVIHGTSDTVVDISCAQHVQTLVPNTVTRYWDGAGHAPFVEDPPRFAAQVREFVSATAGALR
ncbi:UNVERIFIED_CONTAM: alpha-beta hydrolase superfamily lysophospholipase [Williamsia faeni]